MICIICSAWRRIRSFGSWLLQQFKTKIGKKTWSINWFIGIVQFIYVIVSCSCFRTFMPVCPTNTNKRIVAILFMLCGSIWQWMTQQLLRLNMRSSEIIEPLRRCTTRYIADKWILNMISDLLFLHGSKQNQICLQHKFRCSCLLGD